jgi:hypothetical protein
MPLGDFEREVLRALAANRNPDSFIAGATVLHQRDESPRRSEDVDVFHDLPEALLLAYEADVGALRAGGFEVEPVGRVQAEFRRAIVRRNGLQTKIEWVQDAAFRFFPVEPDLELGWRLHFWDAATNKVLAMLTYVENGTEFTQQFGDINGAFYSSLESAAAEFSRLLLGEGKNAYQQFHERIGRVESRAEHIGWGYGDYIRDWAWTLENELGAEP